jgi:hypothetical protein
LCWGDRAATPLTGASRADRSLVSLVGRAPMEASGGTERLGRLATGHLDV